MFTLALLSCAASPSPSPPPRRIRSALKDGPPVALPIAVAMDRVGALALSFRQISKASRVDEDQPASVNHAAASCASSIFSTFAAARTTTRSR
jgi:hypothetical protein